MRVLVVDDEVRARSRLRRLLEKHPDVSVVGEAANGQEALDSIDEERPDVVFLDIEMPLLSGFEVANSVGHLDIRIVFVTAFDAHALQAFEANAVDYLLKPVEEERLGRTLRKLRAAPNGAGYSPEAVLADAEISPALTRLGVKSGNRYIVCDTSRISAVIASGNYCEIVFDEKRILADQSLEKIAQKLDGRKFVRIHRGSLINMDFLKEMVREGDRKYVARLSDYFETTLAVSRESLPRLKELLSIE